MMSRYKVIEKEDQFNVYLDNARMYELTKEGTLWLPVSKNDIRWASARIPKTKEGLVLHLISNNGGITFPRVKKLECLEGRIFEKILYIEDNGEQTLIDWIKNRKKYEYTIWFK